MITILYINPSGCIGGAEKSLTDLVMNLPLERFQFLVVLLSPGPFREELDSKGIDYEVIALPPALLRLSREKNRDSFYSLCTAPVTILPALYRLIILVRTRKIDIIHTNGIKAHLLGIVLSLFSRRLLVWHFRDLLDEGVYARLFRSLARIFPGKIIANSNKVKERLGNLEKISVVYNAVDVPAAGMGGDRRQQRTTLGLQADDIAVGTVGHFAPLKGYEDFVRAMPLILERIPRARFLIVGEAIYPAYLDYKQWIIDLVNRLGLTERVIFTGYRENVGTILNALDIFVLSSWSEGFGRANLEAMAAGKPVVSTDVGGIPEVVIDGKTGLLVPPRDPPALAEAIIRLAQDKNLRKKMGKEGRRRAEQFSIEKMVDGVVEVYDKLAPPTAGLI